MRYVAYYLLYVYVMYMKCIICNYRVHSYIIIILSGVSIHWTGLLDWNTGLDYWTELFSFFGQVSVLIFRKEPTFLQSTSTYLATMNDHNNDNSCLLQCF